MVKLQNVLTHNLWDELRNTHQQYFFEKKSLEDLIKE